MKKIVVSVVNGGSIKECPIQIPQSITNQLENDDLRKRMETLFSDLFDVEVAHVEIIEEVRHECYGRRWNDVRE